MDCASSGYTEISSTDTLLAPEARKNVNRSLLAARKIGWTINSDTLKAELEACTIPSVAKLEEDLYNMFFDESAFTFDPNYRNWSRKKDY